MFSTVTRRQTFRDGLCWYIPIHIFNSSGIDHSTLLESCYTMGDVERTASQTPRPYEIEVLFHEGEKLEQESHLLGICKRQNSKEKLSSLREHLVGNTCKTSLKEKSWEGVGRIFKVFKKQK